jgi:hypothetical protein
MIQLIGFMMGAYIFTRLLEIATTPSVNVAVRIVAMLAILVDLFCLLGLLASGASMPPGLR